MPSRSSSTQRTQRREHAEATAPPNQLRTPPTSPAAGQALAMVSEVMAQMFRTTANLQMAQQDLAQQAARLYDEAAEELRHAQDFGELVRIQSKVMNSCVQATAACCQDLMLAGVKLPDARLKPPTQATAPEPGTAASATEVALNAMAPAMQAWQQFLSMAADSSRTLHH